MTRIRCILWLESRMKLLAGKRQRLADTPAEAEKLDAEWKQLDDLRQYHLARTCPYDDWMLEVLRSDFSPQEILMIHLGRLAGASRDRHSEQVGQLGFGITYSQVPTPEPKPPRIRKAVPIAAKPWSG